MSVPLAPVITESELAALISILDAYWAFGGGAFAGPLRTAPEQIPGHGGCEAINPRHGDPSWRRWWVAMDRRHRRWAARRAFLMANAEWLGVEKAHEVLPMPGWVGRGVISARATTHQGPEASPDR